SARTATCGCSPPTTPTPPSTGTTPRCSGGSCPSCGASDHHVGGRHRCRRSARPRRMPRGEVGGQRPHPVACGRRAEDLDVVAELEELAYRLDVGVADDDGAPRLSAVPHLAESGTEDAPRQVETARAEQGG